MFNRTLYIVSKKPSRHGFTLVETLVSGFLIMLACFFGWQSFDSLLRQYQALRATQAIEQIRHEMASAVMKDFSNFLVNASMDTKNRCDDHHPATRDRGISFYPIRSHIGRTTKV